MAMIKGVLCLVVLYYSVLLVCSDQEDQQPAPPSTFFSSLVSRVREAEPREIREYRTSCIREPGCRWKCTDDGSSHCRCVCGSQKKNKSNTRN